MNEEIGKETIGSMKATVGEYKSGNLEKAKGQNAWMIMMIIGLTVYAIIVSSVKIKTKVIDNAMMERERLLVMKAQTEQLVTANGTPELRQVFRNMGYAIAEPKAPKIDVQQPPDTTKNRKK